jgi:hypothetical protein
MEHANGTAERDGERRQHHQRAACGGLGEQKSE